MDIHDTDAAAFLQSWANIHIRSSDYPITLHDARNHAEAFMRAATNEGISQGQIIDAIRGKDLMDVMVLKMRDSVERSPRFRTHW